MTDDRGLSRRHVLSGLATVGSLGAISGAGAAGLFTEEELFTGNLLAAGELDLSVCWGEDGETCTPQTGPVTVDFGPLERGQSGVSTIQCNLEDNPGWTWLRTNCPDKPCGIQEAVEVSLWYDMDCDGEKDDGEYFVSVSLSEAQQAAIADLVSEDIDLTTPVEIKELPLCDALTILHFGTLLDSNPESETADPFQPGGWCCLGFEWEVVEYICIEDSFELTFELFTQQWRHNLEPSTPWPDTEVCTVDCRTECQDCAPKQGISFVAFCIEDGTIDQGDVRLLPYYDVEGEVYKVEWESEVPLDWVVLFYGSNEGKYFENFAVDGDTSGVVHVNSETHTPDDEDYHSKLLWKGGQYVTDLGQCPRDPCPDLSMGPWGCGVRYNFESDDDWEAGTWDDVCGQACASENGGGS